MNRNKLLLFLPFIVAILLSGLWTSLQRLGWPLPGWDGSLMEHGPLMIIGFLSTLISLERAVALQKKWTFAPPVLFATGAVLSLIPTTQNGGFVLLVLGSLIFFAVMVYLAKMQSTNFNIVMASASGLLLLGNILWAFGSIIPEIIFYWIGFLMLTILGERLELTRMMPIKKAQKHLGLFLIILAFISVLLVTYNAEIGALIFGISITLLSIWFTINDIARKTIKTTGQAKFTATGLLLGYFWLFASGLLLIFNGFAIAGPIYDAFTHTTFLGFVFGMIFVHAPIIFPAVFGQPIAFSNRFYGHLYLLQVTLAGRIYADLTANMELRMWFGLLNVITILLFFGNTLFSVIQAKRSQ